MIALLQVNLASRMESTGMPTMIQLSQQSYDLLSNTYPQFMCSERGEIEVKVGAISKTP